MGKEAEDKKVRKFIEDCQEYILNPPPEFPGLQRMEVTLKDFSDQLLTIITNEFIGFICMDENFNIKINLITGEYFEVKIT